MFAVVLWHGPTWLDSSTLHGLSSDEKVTAVDDFRGRLLQLGAGLVATIALVFTARNFVLSREGHITDRYTKAIEQLGSDGLDVRLGAIYALERIMLDSAKDHPTIVEVLAAFVRAHSPWDPPDEDWRGYDPEEFELPTMPADVVAAVTVLGRRPTRRLVDEQGRLNLQWSFLGSARLEGLNLDGALLRGSYLDYAWLTGTTLREASLEYVNLSSARMQHATLDGANLSRANLNTARLQGASLAGANLSKAELRGARLDGASLRGADLSGADLTRARLTNVDVTGAVLADADLSRATLDGTDLSTAKDISGMKVDSPSPQPESGKTVPASDDGAHYKSWCRVSSSGSSAAVVLVLQG